MAFVFMSFFWWGNYTKAWYIYIYTYRYANKLHNYDTYVTYIYIYIFNKSKNSWRYPLSDVHSILKEKQPGPRKNKDLVWLKKMLFGRTCHATGIHNDGHTFPTVITTWAQNSKHRAQNMERQRNLNTTYIKRSNMISNLATKHTTWWLFMDLSIIYSILLTTGISLWVFWQKKHQKLPCP